MTEARMPANAVSPMTLGDVFNAVDIDRSGGITPEEVLSLNAAMGIRLKEEQLSVFMAADKNSDLEVDSHVRSSAAVERSLACLLAKSDIRSLARSPLPSFLPSLLPSLPRPLIRQEWLASLEAASGRTWTLSDSFSSLPMENLIGGPINYDTLN